MNNIEKNSSRNVFLDLFKLFLCFLVISIHVLNKTYSHYPLYRIAVPMFFMISGYFLYDKDHEKMKNKGLNFIKRSAKYLIIGTLIYTIFELICCIKDGTSIGWFFTTLFYEGNDIIFNFFIFNAPLPYYTVGGAVMVFNRIIYSGHSSLFVSKIQEITLVLCYYFCSISYLFFLQRIYVFDSRRYCPSF